MAPYSTSLRNFCPYDLRRIATFCAYGMNLRSSLLEVPVLLAPPIQPGSLICQAVLRFGSRSHLNHICANHIMNRPHSIERRNVIGGHEELEPILISVIRPANTVSITEIISFETHLLLLPLFAGLVLKSLLATSVSTLYARDTLDLDPHALNYNIWLCPTEPFLSPTWQTSRTSPSQTNPPISSTLPNVCTPSQSLRSFEPPPFLTKKDSFHDTNGVCLSNFCIGGW